MLSTLDGSRQTIQFSNLVGSYTLNLHGLMGEQLQASNSAAAFLANICVQLKCRSSPCLPNLALNALADTAPRGTPQATHCEQLVRPDPDRAVDPGAVCLRPLLNGYRRPPLSKGEVY